MQEGSPHAKTGLLQLGPNTMISLKRSPTAMFPTIYYPLLSISKG